MPTFHPRSTPTDNVIHLDSYRTARLAATSTAPEAWLITGPLVTAALNNAWRAGGAAGKALREARD
jgi:hypothetical protein